MTSTLFSSVRRFSQAATSVFITDPNNLVGAALSKCAQKSGIQTQEPGTEKFPLQTDSQPLRVIFHTPRPLPDALMMRPFDFLEAEDQRTFRNALEKIQEIVSSANRFLLDGGVVRHLFLDPYSSVLGLSAATLWSDELKVIDRKTQIINGVDGVSSTLLRLGPWSKKLTEDYLARSATNLALQVLPLSIGDISLPRELVWEGKTLRDGSIRRR